jgi:ribonuclease BN (tRNA processing enzyme)
LGYVHPKGLTKADYAEFCAGADFLIHDAEYTPQEYKQYIEWGHSSYADVLDLAISAKVKKLGLFHLSQDRSDDAMDEIVDLCRKQIAAEGHAIKCIAVGSDMTFQL